MEVCKILGRHGPLLMVIMMREIWLNLTGTVESMPWYKMLVLTWGYQTCVFTASGHTFPPLLPVIFPPQKQSQKQLNFLWLPLFIFLNWQNVKTWKNISSCSVTVDRIFNGQSLCDITYRFLKSWNEATRMVPTTAILAASHSSWKYKIMGKEVELSIDILSRCSFELTEQTQS